MPSLRSLAVALALGVGIGVYLETALRWPTFINVGVGAVMALVVLLIAASVGDDAEAVDALWREEAPDLVVRRLGPGPEPTGSGPAGRGTGSAGPTTGSTERNE